MRQLGKLGDLGKCRIALFLPGPLLALEAFSVLTNTLNLPLFSKIIGLGFARFLLIGFDRGLDHLLELGGLDAVFVGKLSRFEVKHPLNCWQRCQPLHLLHETACTFSLGVGEVDNLRRLVHWLGPPSRTRRM
jgi:hypothetical protein